MLRDSRLRRAFDLLAVAVLVGTFSACAGSIGVSAGSSALPAARSVQYYRASGRAARHTVGLGPVVQSAFGGNIYGFDIDQNGNDGVLSETVNENSPPYFLNAIETFDEATGKITKVVRKTRTEGNGPLPVVEAIAGNDIGLIDDQAYFVKNGLIVRDDKYVAMNPVSEEKVNGKWTPPKTVNLVPNFVSNNQASSSEFMVAYHYGKNFSQKAELYAFDVTTRKWQRPFVFPKAEYTNPYQQYAAVDTKTNTAATGFETIAYGTPSFHVFDAATGRLRRTFQGLGHGWINGMAIDSTTGIMCTTTFSDLNVEFYTLSNGKGFEVTLPGSGGALTSGAAVAGDSINHLFLIAQLNSTVSPSGGSTVYVYDEKGNLIETINGFNFLNLFSPVVPHLAVNPSQRIGYVNGPNQNELQEFAY